MNINRALVSLDQITSVDQLRRAADAVDGMVSESICRKYLSQHRDDPDAWRALLSAIERNENYAEAIRIGREMLRQFPESTQVASFVGITWCHHGNVGGATQLLSDISDSLNPAATLYLAQLLLLKDPKKAKSLFEGLLAKNPGLLEASLGVASAVSLLKRGTRRPIAFFLYSGWHRSIQQSVFEACADRSLPCFMTLSGWLLRAFNPKVLVVSDTLKLSELRKRLPDMTVVHTRHGLSDKNYSFFAASAADFICVTSQAVADDYIEKGMFNPERFWITGYPQLDSLFARMKSSKKRSDGKTVLFAPTFTNGLSASEPLGADAVKLIRGDDTSIRVIIRPHPVMTSDRHPILNTWRVQSFSMPNVEINEDPNIDICDLMIRAAAAVSDVSSVGLSYLALDRPLIFVDIGSARTSPNFSPDGIEWKAREALGSYPPAALAGAVREALADPTKGSTQRRDIRKHLFGELFDGRAGERISSKIGELFANA